MKQYTTPEQTAKLIELGFERPKNRVIKQLLDRSTDSWITIGEEGDYSIGELIEMLGYDLYSIHYKGLAWTVQSERVETRENELIDALYDMLVRLKEEGVI